MGAKKIMALLNLAAVIERESLKASDPKRFIWSVLKRLRGYGTIDSEGLAWLHKKLM